MCSGSPSATRIFRNALTRSRSCGAFERDRGFVVRGAAAGVDHDPAVGQRHDRRLAIHQLLATEHLAERHAAEDRAKDEWSQRRAELQRSYARELIEAVEELKNTTGSLLDLPWLTTPSRQAAVSTAPTGLSRTSATSAAPPPSSPATPEIRNRLNQLLLICNQVRGLVPRNPGTGIENRLKADVIAYCVYTVAGIEQWASYQDITATSDGPALFRNVLDKAIWTPAPDVPPN